MIYPAFQTLGLLVWHGRSEVSIVAIQIYSFVVLTCVQQFRVQTEELLQRVADHKDVAAICWKMRERTFQFFALFAVQGDGCERLVGLHLVNTICRGA